MQCNGMIATSPYAHYDDAMLDNGVSPSMSISLSNFPAQKPSFPN